MVPELDYNFQESLYEADRANFQFLGNQMYFSDTEYDSELNMTLLRNKAARYRETNAVLALGLPHLSELSCNIPLYNRPGMYSAFNTLINRVIDCGYDNLMSSRVLLDRKGNWQRVPVDYDFVSHMGMQEAVYDNLLAMENSMKIYLNTNGNFMRTGIGTFLKFFLAVQDRVAIDFVNYDPEVKKTIVLNTCANPSGAIVQLMANSAIRSLNYLEREFFSKDNLSFTHQIMQYNPEHNCLILEPSVAEFISSRKHAQREYVRSILPGQSVPHACPAHSLVPSDWGKMTMVTVLADRLLELMPKSYWY